MDAECDEVQELGNYRLEALLLKGRPDLWDHLAHRLPLVVQEVEEEVLLVRAFSCWERRS